VNAWGVLLVIIGFLLLVIGIKGTQSQVLAAFKGIKQGETAPTLKSFGV
jgi:hypothetical protein